MTQRDRIVIVVVGAVVALAAFWFLALGPKRNEAATLGGQITAQQTRLQKAQAELAGYRAARSRYSRNYATVARLGKAVPADDDVPSLLYQLESSAQKTNVDFRQIKVTGGGGTPATPPAPTPAPGAAGASAPATQTAAAALPPGSSIGSAGFPTMPFNFTFQGNFFHLSSFFGRLQRFIVANHRTLSVSGRLLTIDGISLSAAASGFPQMKASIAATGYLLPDEQGLMNGASPSSPAAGAAGSAQPASTSPSSPAPAPTPAAATGPTR